jgi:5-methylthioadenosine/S-adenosylhomocysteine deaminase
VITLVQGGYVVAFDGEGHRLITDGVVYRDDRIPHVGNSYDGHVDRKIDAVGRLVSPGFINIHGWAVLDVPLRMDAFKGARWQSKECVADGIGLDDFGPLGGDFRRITTAEIISPLKGGVARSVTLTAMDPALWESPPEQTKMLADLLGEMGIRAYVSDSYRSAMRYWSPDGLMRFHWNQQAGMNGPQHGIEFGERYHGAYGGLIPVMLFPYTFECLSAVLLHETRSAARERGSMVHMRTAQLLSEYREILRCYARMLIQYLHEAGFLEDQVMVTPCHLYHGQPDLRLPQTRRERPGGLGLLRGDRGPHPLSSTAASERLCMRSGNNSGRTSTWPLALTSFGWT